MVLQRGIENWQPKEPEPEINEIIDTDWDTKAQEVAFLSAAIEYFGPFGRNEQKLFRLLDCGVDETWFVNPARRFLYLGLFSCSLKINSPGVTVRVGAIIEEAENLSGQKNWAREEIARITDGVGIFDLEEFIEKDVPLWWHKLKKPKTLSLLGQLNLLLAHMPPTLDRLQEIDHLANAALDCWRAEPSTGHKEEALHDNVRTKCLQPIPSNYSIELGLSVFDEMLNGGVGGANSPDSGRLIVVCARPGAGKSLVASNIAARVAANSHKVAFWSFEMGEEEMAMRDIAMKDFFHCRVHGIQDPITYKNLKRRSYTEAQRKRLETEEYQIIDENMSIMIGNSSMTAEHIANHMRTFARRHPSTRLFIIDHLGLLNISNANRAVAVGEATRQLKVTARELGIDVLLLCQLNRGVESRDDKRPTLSDLRDSGRIEEDSDIVLGLYRPAYYNEEDPALQNILEVIALKNRQGKSNYALECNVYLDSCAIVDPGCAKHFEPEYVAL